MAKASKARKAGTKKASVTPTYMKGKKPLKIGLHDVIRVLKVIDDEGHMSKFTTAAKKKKTVMLVDPNTVNFIKDFMVENNMHDHPIGKHVVNARTAPAGAALGMRAGAAAAGGPPKDPFECDLSRH
jgi:hypothetical protein